MASIFSAAPTTPVNKGLAADIKPMYPEQMQMLKDFNEKKRQDAKDERAIRIQNQEYIDKKALDPEGLSPYEVEKLNKMYSGIVGEYTQDNLNNNDPMMSQKYTEKLREYENIASQYRIAGTIESDILLGSKKGGKYEGYVDKDKISQAVIEERRAAEKEGRVPDFTGLVDDPEYWSRSKLRNGFNESLSLQYDQEIREVPIDGSEESLIQLQRYADTNIWEVDEKSGDYIYENGERVVKKEPTGKFLEQVRADSLYFQKLQVEAAKTGKKWSELAYQDFLQSNNISEIEQVIKPSKERSPTGPEQEKADALRLVHQITTGMQPGASKSQQQVALSTLSNAKTKYTLNGNKVKVELSKSFFEKLSMGEAALELARAGVDRNEISAAEQKGELADLIQKKIKEGVITRYIDLSKGFRSGVMEMIRLSNLAKGTSEAVVMNDYLNSLPEGVDEYYQNGESLDWMTIIGESLGNVDRTGGGGGEKGTDFFNEQ